MKVQPGKCHTADGYLAQAWLSQGDTEKVGELYTEHIDLDPHLALVQGNAALIDGNISLARSAYHRAAMLERHPGTFSRLGQALIHENVGEWANAQTLYEKVLELNPYDVMGAQMWVDASIRATSPAATTRATERFLQNNPDSGAAYTAHARALRLAGDEAKLQQLIRQGDTYFTNQLKLFPSSGSLAANHALFMVETGRLSEGQAAAEAALIEEPDAVLAWLALGNAYVLLGDIERGENMFRRAGRLGSSSPGYALLINTDIPEPETAVEEDASE